MTTGQTFRAAVEAHDVDAIAAGFTPDATFHSPAVFQPYVGRQAIHTLLGVLLQIFQEFRYTDEFDAADGTKALLFRARVGDKELQGLDVLRFNDDGMITDLTVMIRPYSALQTLMQAVAPRLEAAMSDAGGKD